MTISNPFPKYLFLQNLYGEGIAMSLASHGLFILTVENLCSYESYKYWADPNKRHIFGTPKSGVYTYRPLDFSFIWCRRTSAYIRMESDCITVKSESTEWTDILQAERVPLLPILYTLHTTEEEEAYEDFVNYVDAIQPVVNRPKPFHLSDAYVSMLSLQASAKQETYL